MWRLLPLSLLQCICLSSGQVLLKFALMRMAPVGWNMPFIKSVFLNWQFIACGVAYGIGSLLWMYILKNFPFSLAYPMISLSYVIGMFSAIIFFHETITVWRWIGVLLIVGGCCLVVK